MESCAYFDKALLDRYLGKDLYCREEQQFAVFLYHMLLEAKRSGKAVTNEKIKECLRIGEDREGDIIIKDVFFEATIMRDFFEEDRKKDKDFNKQLLEYCLGGAFEENEKINQLNMLTEFLKNRNGLDIASCNLGQNEVRKMIKKLYDSGRLETAIHSRNSSYDEEQMIQEAKVRTCLEIASMMMNAVPDILVIYEKRGKEGKKMYAKALECKYTSDEGTYRDILGTRKIKQLFIQKCIMHFCFGKYKGGDEEKYSSDFPAKSKAWGGNSNLWEKTCGCIYDKILEQERQSKGVLNAGAEIIRFISFVNKSKKYKEKVWC